MKGTYKIRIQNKRIRYEFEIKRNITILQGESATGKTTLIDMVREFEQNGVNSGIQLSCRKSCTVLEGKNWKVLLSVIRDSIVFIDEGNNFVKSKEFATVIQNSDNYYVIVTRESLPALPYSVSEIYGIRNSGKYGFLEQVYNELYPIYGVSRMTQESMPEIVITEDSNSGFQFFKAICEEDEIQCISAKGKSNVFGLVNQRKEGTVLVIADGAAFGAEIGKLYQLLKAENGQLFQLYLPESFEWLILSSNVLEDSEINIILTAPQDYIESCEYFSWEQFFTHLLVEKTRDTYFKYEKGKINEVYLHDQNRKKILNEINGINFL